LDGVLTLVKHTFGIIQVKNNGRSQELVLERITLWHKLSGSFYLFSVPPAASGEKGKKQAI
jgi:hypothetical protein